MKNTELLESLKDAVRRERLVTAEIISYLAEVEKRMLFAELGYSSLIVFCIRELGYSETAAYRRVNAMRLSKDIPEVKRELEEGGLSLTVVSQVQSFVKQQKIKDVKIKKQLLENVRGKATREVEKHFAMIAPLPIPKERERVVTKDETEVRVVLNDRAMEKLKRIRDRWSHKNTNYSYAELIEAMADVVLEETSKTREVKSRFKKAPVELKAEEHCGRVEEWQVPPAPEPVKAVQVSVGSLFSCSDPYSDEDHIAKNHIPAAIKRAVWRRDQGKCQHSGCNSTFLIQIDPPATKNLRRLKRARQFTPALRDPQSRSSPISRNQENHACPCVDSTHLKPKTRRTIMSHDTVKRR